MDKPSLSPTEPAAPCSDIISNLNFGNNDKNHEIENEKNIQKSDNLINKEMAVKKHSILKPRDYQQKIFDKAKDKNSIIYVETGKGKTFISIMLMAYHLGIDLNNTSNSKIKFDKNKKIIFFVCDTALIEQQKKAISKILNIEVGTIQGKKSKKSKSDFDLFKKMWDSVTVFVAIPSVIYKMLSCGFLKIFDISMMVFDECHHTSDEHPYNKIMNEFYFFYKKQMPQANLNYPRIYGLTASPLKKGIKKPFEASILKAMEKLSENLDSVIVIDPEMNNSNAKMMKPQESIKDYLNDDSYIEVKSHIDMDKYKQVAVSIINSCYFELMSIGFYYLKKQYPSLADEKTVKKYKDYSKMRLKSKDLEDYNQMTEQCIDLYNLRKQSLIFLIFETLQRQIFMILENLGLNSLILFFDNLIDIYTKLYIQKLDEEKDKNFNISNDENSDESSYNLLNSESNDDKMNDDDSDLVDVTDLKPSIIEEIKDIFVKTSQQLKELMNNGQDYISDRLKKLYQKIYDLFKENKQSKFIIFISNRIVAHFLHPELNIFLNKNFPDKKCREIIGINKRKSNSGTTLTPSLTLKQMNEIIRQFNEDEFNILIGTSAIEEGLDIQSCNAVLTLVELRTPKSFIQIKGRARKSNSQFIIFTNSAKNGKQKVEDFLNIGQKMNELFKGNIMKDFRRVNFISKKEEIKFIFDQRSHAKLTLGNVTIFYNEIVQQIKAKRIKFDVNPKITKVKSHDDKSPEFVFHANISIQTDLKGISKYFPFELGSYNKKDEAQKWCYFYVLDVLKKNNYLDQHLKFHLSDSD